MLLSRDFVQARTELEAQLRRDLACHVSRHKEYLKIFPRHDTVWLQLAAIVEPHEVGDVLEAAIDRCYKSRRVWEKYVEIYPERKNEMQDAIGHDLDLPSNLSPFKIHPLLEDRIGGDDDENVFQQMVFHHYDDPTGWTRYANWLIQQHRSDDALSLLTRACIEFCPHNEVVIFESGKILAQLNEIQLAQELFRSLITITNRIQIIEEIIAFENSLGNLEYSLSILQRFEEPFLQLFKFQTLELMGAPSGAVLSELIDTVSDPKILAYAIMHAPPRDIENVLSANYHQFVRIFGPNIPPCLVPKGKPAPRPVDTKPNRGSAASHQMKEPSRALPGYTPGWMAAEYARQHIP